MARRSTQDPKNTRTPEPNQTCIFVCVRERERARERVRERVSEREGERKREKERELGEESRTIEVELGDIYAFAWYTYSHPLAI